MIVFAATPMPFCNLKYVNQTVPAPAPTSVAPRSALPMAPTLLFEVLAPASVDRFLHNDAVVLSTSLDRVNWVLAERAVREPATDTREKSAMDGSTQLGWLCGGFCQRRSRSEE